MPAFRRNLLLPQSGMRVRFLCYIGKYYQHYSASRHRIWISPHYNESLKARFHTHRQIKFVYMLRQFTRVPHISRSNSLLLLYGLFLSCKAIHNFQSDYARVTRFVSSRYQTCGFSLLSLVRSGFIALNLCLLFIYTFHNL